MTVVAHELLPVWERVRDACEPAVADGPRAGGIRPEGPAPAHGATAAR